MTVTERVRLRDDKRLGNKPMSQRVPTIDTVLTDRQLLGAALGSSQSWQTWRVVLKSAFGIALNREEARAFASVAGSRTPPQQRVRELWCIIGRRGGKSRIAAAIAVYLACFVKHKLAPGERGLILTLAASQAQAGVVFGYVKAFLQDSPVLRQEVESFTASEIRLRNGITIAIHSNSFRTIRGRTLCAAIFDEVAIWRDELSATPDIEVYTSVLPSLLTTKGLLIGISTGYRRTGLLYQKYRDHFGQDSADTLVVQGSTLSFNKTLSEDDIAAQPLADPSAAVAEWDGGFRDDVASFLDDALIDAAIDRGRPLELPPFTGTFYRAFVDPAGGVGHDSYVLCICHKHGQYFVVDAIRGTPKGKKYDPVEVTRQYAALCKEFRIHSIVSDGYSAEWCKSAWRAENVTLVRSDLSASEIYLEALPLFARNLVKIPEQATLIKELRLLERRTARSGKDTISHPTGGNDDYANALCGCLQQLSSRLGSYSLDAFQDDFVDLDAPDRNNKPMQPTYGTSEWQRQQLAQYVMNGGIR